MRRSGLIKLFFLVVLCGISLCLRPAMADNVNEVVKVATIPTLASIPDSLNSEERTKFANQRQDLQNQLAGYKTAAAAYSAKTYNEQTDAEFNKVDELRKDYTDAANAFNKALAAEVAAETAGAALPAGNNTAGNAGQIEKLKKQIASDEEAIRRLGFQKRAADFEEWSELTEQTRKQFISETLRILGRLALDEATIGLKDQASNLSSSLTTKKCEGLITRLNLADDSWIADKIRALAKATTIKQRTDAANDLILFTTKYAETEYDLNSPEKNKAYFECFCETMADISSKKFGLVGWQTRALVSSAELTTELGYAFGEQHIAESTIRDLDHMTEEQLKAVQKLSDVLRKHVEELKAAKQQANP